MQTHRVFSVVFTSCLTGYGVGDVLLAFAGLRAVRQRIETCSTDFLVEAGVQPPRGLGFTTDPGGHSASHMIFFVRTSQSAM